MPFFNCEVNLTLTWPSTCVNTNSTGAGRFSIIDTNLYVPVVTLSTQDNAKLLQQLKSGFKRTINWNKYQSDPKTYAQNQYFNDFVNPSFQEVNRLFVLSFENENGRTSHSEYYLPKVEIKDYNVKIDGKSIFDQPVKSYKITYEKLEKLLLVKEMITQMLFIRLSYFKENYKMLAIDLSKQQALDAVNTTMFFIIEEAKETVSELCVV